MNSEQRAKNFNKSYPVGSEMFWEGRTCRTCSIAYMVCEDAVVGLLHENKPYIVPLRFISPVITVEGLIKRLDKAGKP